MPTKTIPLFGSFTSRSGTTFGSKDQEFINCFPEVISNSLSGNRIVELYKRDGVISVAETAASNLSSFGACVWESKADGSAPPILSFLKSTSDNVRIYRVSGGSTVAQVGGDIASTSNCYFLNDTLVSGVSNITGVFTDSSSGAKEVWFFPEGGAWTQITDGDFPPNIGTPEPITPYIAHLDGYMFVMSTNGKIWNSDVNSIANWTASSYITAQAAADNGTAIARYKDYIVAGGTRSIEFFYNAGNPTGSVLSPVANSVINIGVARADNNIPTMRTIGDTLYFIGVDSGVYGFYQLAGNQAKKISTQAVDKFFSPGDDLVLGIAGGFMLNEKRHIMFNSVSNGTKNFCYCIDNDFWWTLTLASQAKSINAIVSGTVSGDARTYFNNYSAAANVYRFDDTDFRDDSSAYTMTVRTNGLDFDTDEEKFVSDIWLNADTQASGTATLEKSDDDYGSWQTLGTFDMTKHEKRITRCGSHRGERAYRLTHSANTAFRARSLRIKYTAG